MSIIIMKFFNMLIKCIQNYFRFKYNDTSYTILYILVNKILQKSFRS